MRNSHSVVVEQNGKTQHYRIACAGKLCTLCASTAEDRAKITFVRGA